LCDKICKLIKSNLTPELLPKTWLKKNEKKPLYGHCYGASRVLQRIFGEEHITLFRGLDHTGEYHWWVQDDKGEIVDLTSEQYTSQNLSPPYDKGKKCSPLVLHSYMKRVERLYRKVSNEFNSTQNRIFFE